MREKVKNPKKTTPELYHDSKNAEESVALTENNKVLFFPEGWIWATSPFNSWRLGIILIPTK